MQLHFMCVHALAQYKINLNLYLNFKFVVLVKSYNQVNGLTISSILSLSVYTCKIPKYGVPLPVAITTVENAFCNFL